MTKRLCHVKNVYIYTVLINFCAICEGMLAYTSILTIYLSNFVTQRLCHVKGVYINTVLVNFCACTQARAEKPTILSAVLKVIVRGYPLYVCAVPSATRWAPAAVTSILSALPLLTQKVT